ncbi:sulfonate ABC transporter substrate-binding protein [Polycladomyces subterraneus]|uniref:Sulfonate ABC transporter substrate-binding protein n=1 Tax=Polycladomyces subterraneus TaxID=1016997 RepID=A0ABT8IQQ9_9BACL|nr:sulfonate ABC transporter substrate-binding protein [Polycladomyces subterraneus]MDN4595130.1 sulfonate ABC transporter substrate-binding protein [Polycladomyces subterraneus]
MLGFFKRKRLISMVIALSISLLAGGVLGGCNAGASEADGKVVRIGYQKFGTLSILKARGTLDKRLKSKGIKVEWVQFPAGPQLLEAMNVGSIDIGHTGNTPPIFAQAAKTPLVYVGAGAPKPENEAIVVPKDSTIKSVKDLKGKKVALNKGSNVHDLLLQVLNKAGLEYKDIQPVYLPPADARAAFTRKSVDAWVIWDPYYSAAEKELGARTITDGRGYTTNREFILASETYAKEHGDIVRIILDEVKKTTDWFNQHPDDTAKLLAKQIGMDVGAVKKAITRSKYGLQPMDESIIREQQRIADAFYQVGLIPERIQVEKAVWNGNRVKTKQERTEKR